MNPLIPILFATLGLSEHRPESLLELIARTTTKCDSAGGVESVSRLTPHYGNMFVIHCVDGTGRKYRHPGRGRQRR